MINVGLQVRRAVAEDYHQIAQLILYEANSHRHLDWRPPLDWIGFPNYWVLEENGHIVAVLACPEDPPHVAWIRLFGYHPHLSVTEAWSALWEVARSEITDTNSQTQVAVIVVKSWFQNLLLSSGFELKQNITLLQLTSENVKPFLMPSNINIRPMQEADVDEVVKIDLAAFGSFWHNTFDAIQRAYLQSLSATVAEDDSGLIVGYQLSTGNPLGAHLARLGVRPEAQGQGVGTALVGDLVQRVRLSRIDRLSVNTQADNVASLALYKKLGFVRTGEQFPVFVYPMSTTNG
jgi:[ribosomal protein S18]-alanine N-acetyltransferase